MNGRLGICRLQERQTWRRGAAQKLLPLPPACEGSRLRLHPLRAYPLNGCAGGFQRGSPCATKRKGGPRPPLRYPRFTTAAEAIRFAIEELPTVRALGAWMQVGDERLDGDDILRLYQSDHYPLQRRLSD
jgi:hypothetical protein